MITIIDYGAGNIRSVQNAFAALGVKCVLSKDKDDLLRADGLVLPGVGAFGYAAKMLRESGVFDTVRECAESGKPLLGICLGMQLLFSRSEESPGYEGLGLIDGSVRQLIAPGLTVPNMGWTSVENVRGSLMRGTRENEFFYFVHSYACHASDRGDCAAEAVYGERFDAAVQRGNVMGTQFHPEKSSKAGARLIENFIGICGKNQRTG